MAFKIAQTIANITVIFTQQWVVWLSGEGRVRAPRAFLGGERSPHAHIQSQAAGDGQAVPAAGGGDVQPVGMMPRPGQQAGLQGPYAGAMVVADRVVQARCHQGRTPARPLPAAASLGSCHPRCQAMEELVLSRLCVCVVCVCVCVCVCALACLCGCISYVCVCVPMHVDIKCVQWSNVHVGGNFASEIVCLC